MFGIGPWELLIVFAIVLLLFGGKRLPGIATGLGSAIRNFKSSVAEPEKNEALGAKEVAAHELVTEEKDKAQS